MVEDCYFGKALSKVDCLFLMDYGLCAVFVEIR